MYNIIGCHIKIKRLNVAESERKKPMKKGTTIKTYGKGEQSKIENQKHLESLTLNTNTQHSMGNM